MIINRTIIYTVVAGFFLSSCSDNVKEAELPSIVLNSFKTKFRDAADTDWEKKNNGYEVAFEMSNIEHTAQIDESGNIIMHKQEIGITELPSPVSTAITQEFKNYKVDEVEKVEKEKHIFFQVELDGKKEQHLVYAANGKKDTSIPYWD